MYKFKDLLRKISIERKSTEIYCLCPDTMLTIDRHFNFYELRALTNDDYIPF